MMWNLKFYSAAVLTLGLVFQVQFVWSKNTVEVKCGICKDMVENFKKKMKETAKHGFGGGNTDWEESRLGTYSKSESRLIEILEAVCEKVSKESTCQAMVEEHESDIYDWWYKPTKEQPEIQDFLCIERLKVCCPEKTYGPDCKACPGGKDNTCNGHGTCTGSGTRAGSGKCECDTGYEGDECESCNDGYYDAGNSTCNACHESCKDTCSGPGAKSCDECKDGWIANDEEGCIDKNECEDDPTSCGENKYCVNTVGSFDCKDCHESCKDNCSGEGAKNCLDCKEGYQKDEVEGCKDVDECQGDVQCDPGTYCSNTVGSYNCEACHESCQLECNGPGNKNCHACKSGYRMTDGECKDIDECKEKESSSTCPDSNTYCNNLPGSFDCQACDSSCASCLAPGPSGCVKCRPGYRMTDSECKDIDECSEENSCNKETEDCSNTAGSFECACKEGYKKDGSGRCVKNKASEDDDADDEESNDEHTEL